MRQLGGAKSRGKRGDVAVQNSQNCQKALIEVGAALQELAKEIDPHKAAERAYFMKATMPMLGLTVPMQRARLKKGYSFSKLPFEEQVPIWSYIWEHADLHEVKMQAGFFVEKPKVDFDPDWLWKEISPWVDSVNCWDQSDTLSNIYARLNEIIPDQIVPVLEGWNVSDNPWERRQSLVALLCYSRFRKHFPDPDLVFRLVEQRLEDPDYYVQKGVGWTLREAYHVWPRDVLRFLDTHIVILAPAAWQAATEKLKPNDKQALKTKRKSGKA